MRRKRKELANEDAGLNPTPPNRTNTEWNKNTT